MPAIVNGHIHGPRRYTIAESITRIAYLITNPGLLSLRDATSAVYILYVLYVTYYTTRSLVYLVFEEDGRQMWCPSTPPPEWGPTPPGWKIGWKVCARILRFMVWRRLGAWFYEVFAWGLIWVVVTFTAEEWLRWRRTRER
ncbi:hypothetical protein CTRI78_v008236 [Colletotrichum trifolii]|uniref:Uncharacterized protein n=1 Tax=Colletotrichum trifolii TaxID=5466 RepID=A0A4V3HUH4_COLTR|nr:hypothetical protein CTRI78_v008236 [Colletotrichum trifolii]